MKTTTKLLAAGTALVAALGIGTFAFAQHDHSSGQGRMGMGRDMGLGMMMGKGHGRMGAGVGDPTLRLASIKTELGIKAEQQADWDAYAKVVTETAAAGRARRESVDRDAVHKMEPKDRQAFMTSMQEQRQKQFETVKAAAEALLAKLDEPQKVKARETLPGLVAAGPGRGMRHGMMGGHGKGHR